MPGTTHTGALWVSTGSGLVRRSPAAGQSPSVVGGSPRSARPPGSARPRSAWPRRCSPAGLVSHRPGPPHRRRWSPGRPRRPSWWTWRRTVLPELALPEPPSSCRRCCHCRTAVVRRLVVAAPRGWLPLWPWWACWWASWWACWSGLLEGWGSGLGGLASAGPEIVADGVFVGDRRRQPSVSSSGCRRSDVDAAAIGPRIPDRQTRTRPAATRPPGRLPEQATLRPPCGRNSSPSCSPRPPENLMTESGVHSACKRTPTPPTGEEQDALTGRADFSVVRRTPRRRPRPGAGSRRGQPRRAARLPRPVASASVVTSPDADGDPASELGGGEHAARRGRGGGWECGAVLPLPVGDADALVDGVSRGWSRLRWSRTRSAPADGDEDAEPWPPLPPALPPPLPPPPLPPLPPLPAPAAVPATAAPAVPAIG